MTEKTYGNLTGPAVGILLKEAIIRGINAIHQERLKLEVHDKTTDYNPTKADIVTSADLASQVAIAKIVDECFPGWGLIAEENNLRIDTTGDNFITVDACDGTKALRRGQSHGFGPMVSICEGGEVVGAFVGDVMTSEVYYYRPGGTKVHRLNFRTGAHVTLGINAGELLSAQYVLLRDDPRSLPEMLQRFVLAEKSGGIFKDLEVSGGGIGTWLARLWKGEVGACIVNPTNNTPWDLLPVWGISKKLGFKFFFWSQKETCWFERQHVPTMDYVRWDGHTVIIHESRVPEFYRVLSRRYAIN